MDERLRRARDYWESKLAGRSMPARRDLDPLVEIPKLLPWVVLTDVFYDPLDFRYRLIGNDVIQNSRANYTGKRFTELPHTGPDSHVWKDRVRVIETRAPVVAEPPYTGEKHLVSRVSGIHLPLSDDDSTVTLILTVASYSR